MTIARLSVVRSLTDILTKEGRPKQTLEQLPEQLDRRDRAFVMELLYGVLRNLYALDWILARFVKKTNTLGDPTLNNLRAGIYQIFFMRVPDFAVVHEAVELEKKHGKPSLVNAVLRNIIRNKEDIQLPVPFDEPDREISVNTSHPEWLIRRWISRFGISGARSLAEANNRKPPLTIRANTLRISREHLHAKLLQMQLSAEPTPYSPDGIMLGRDVSYEDLEEFTGLYAVQDEASQLVSYLLAPVKGERILDACAAPGGKTIHIAQLMQDQGEIIAIDKDPHRLKQLKQNISSLGVSSVTVTQADIRNLSGIGDFDRILLDAPCSSTGVIRRNPDVRYRHTPGDISEFGRRQAMLLKTVAPLLRRGGRLVYSVCSMEPEEGEAAVADLLKTTEEFRIIDTDQGFLKPFIKNGFFRTLPHVNNMDGFFGVILCRNT
jgi:16S rRNA (cytosine967-C5)-methyltransferase